LAAQTYRVKSKKLAPLHTAVVRLACPTPQIADAFSVAMPEVLDCIARQGSSVAGAAFARYFDYVPERAEFEAGVPVSTPIAAQGRVEPGRLPGGRVARSVHRGPYDGLQHAHDAIGDWVLAHDHDPAGPVWEVYVKGPQHGEDSSRWETEVVWPLRK